MIQLSYDFDGDPPTVAAPLRANVSAAADGPARARLTGHWPHRDLAAARRQVAAVMATMPADRPVRCLFTGRTKPAATWATELATPPSVATVFEARHAIAEGRLWARLFGGYQLGESDIVLLADATADVAEVYRFLSAWGAYRLGDAVEPVWDRPFPWGYHLVSFAEHDVGDADFWALCREVLGAQHLRGAFDERMASPPPRVVIEAAIPGDPDTSYMIGAAEALRARVRQRATRERLGADDAPSPSALDAAGYCDRLLAAWDSGADPDWFAYREPPRGDLDSGWRLGCVDPAHVHDDRSLRIDNLRRARGLRDYLALPPGWVVTREDGAFWTSAPGEAESHRDDAP